MISSNFNFQVIIRVILIALSTIGFVLFLDKELEYLELRKQVAVLKKQLESKKRYDLTDYKSKLEIEDHKVSGHGVKYIYRQLLRALIRIALLLSFYSKLVMYS